MSYRVDKLGDGRTDGQGQRQYPEAKTGLGNKTGWGAFNTNYLIAWNKTYVILKIM